MFFKKMLGAVAILSALAFPAYADGKCADEGYFNKAKCAAEKSDKNEAEIAKLRAQVADLATKLGALTTKVGTLETAVGQAPTPAKVEQIIWQALDDVKIESKAHAGICMWIDDWNNNPNQPDRVVKVASSCANSSHYTMKIRK